MGGLGLEHGLELPAGYVHTYTPCWPVKQPESPGSVESLAGVVPTGSSDDDKLVLADKLVQPQRRPEEDRSQLQGDQELARSLQIEEEAPRLDSIVTSVIADLQATSRCQHRQSRLVQRLGSILKNIFGPSVLLEVFGSTVCNLAGKNSDLDMTFTPGFSKRLSMGEKKTALRKVAKVLQSNGMRAIPVLGARVPIVKIKDVNDTWLAADLSVENELPVFKSRLLNEYALIDDRLSKLVLLVKAWAKARAINSAAQGTFNSFGLSLLVVHYLQVPVLALQPTRSAVNKA
jgi:DNA polymerase sigma